MRSVALALALVAAAAGHAAAEKCVSIKKGAKVYSLAKTSAKAGVATARVAAFVEQRKGPWLRVRFERVEEAWGIGGRVEDGFTQSAELTAFVRKKDTKKARCPQQANVSEIRALAHHDPSLLWPDGRKAGWTDSRHRAARKSTETFEHDGETFGCFDDDELAGLLVRVCATRNTVGDLDAQLEE